jgi:hypothetical protein
MKADVLAALPAAPTGVTYSVTLLSGSIIAKVTITGTGDTAAAAQTMKTTVNANALSVTVGGQPVTSTGAAVESPSGTASGAVGLASFTAGGMAVFILANLIRPFVNF